MTRFVELRIFPGFLCRQFAYSSFQVIQQHTYLVSHRCLDKTAKSHDMTWTCVPGFDDNCLKRPPITQRAFDSYSDYEAAFRLETIPCGLMFFVSSKLALKAPRLN